MTCPLPHHAARYVVSGAWSSHPGRHHATNEDRALLANDLRLIALADGVALLAPGDRFLLCSDGVSDVLDDELLAYVLNLDPDARAVTRALVDGARAAGSEDDVTALVMDVHDERSGGAPWIC